MSTAVNSGSHIAPQHSHNTTFKIAKMYKGVQTKKNEVLTTPEIYVDIFLIQSDFQTFFRPDPNYPT